MTEHGFIWPDGTYVQAIGGDSADLLKGYPDGTVAVPLKPGANYEWQDGAWIEVDPPAITIEQVDAERSRRIVTGRAFTVTGIGDIPIKGTPEAQTSLLGLKDSARDLKAAGVTDAILPMQDAAGTVHKLTADQVISLVDQGKAYITSVDQAAWALQAMEPIPADYTDDSHWPATS